MSNGYYVRFSFSGTVTDADFPELFAGLAVAPYDNSCDIGRPACRAFEFLDCDVAEAIVDRKQVGASGLVLRLDPGVTIVGECRFEIRPAPFFRFAVEPSSASVAIQRAEIP
jgi:hypothetical protein